jgi:hypothetical protein
MKLKQLIFFLVFLSMSCKMTEKNIIGSYKSKESNFNAITLNSDHTFLYVDFDFIKFLEHADIDSCHFITRGNWKLTKNELMLNSFETPYTDTDRLRNIIITQTKSNQSNFSFKDVNGNMILFDRIDDEKDNFAIIADKTYSDFDIALSRHKNLTFYLKTYKPFIYVIKDTAASNYVVTLSPYYKQGYFNDKKFSVKRNRIVNNNMIFKRRSPFKDYDYHSPYIVHGPMSK